MRPAPSAADLARAVEAGEVVRMGLPVRVELDGGYAVPNLALALAGDPDPWTVVAVTGDVVDIQTAGDRGLYVAGLAVSGESLAGTLEALRLAPGDIDRHTPEANAARLRAGRAAMRVTDSMLRARLLDHVDGWTALREASDVIDESTEGTLLRPRPEVGLRCLILVVRCPTTGRVYALKVPPASTAAEARAWVMHGLAPEVET